MRTIPAIAALALGLSLTLTACGNDDEPADTTTSVSATEHNDADVAFATDMIQHHAQALTMVEMTEGRELDPAVEGLADDIRAAQAPEIEAMTGWLAQWGEDIPKTFHDTSSKSSASEMDQMDMQGMDSGMPGMMSADDMEALANASDAKFQDMWLEMMIEHHEGAVEMAESEKTNGQYKPAVELADNVVESQTAEIEMMQGLVS
ncbi:DUF305 domain-containing protein [Nocardioides sp. HDW12B]|uniref:DUF305 domain-containing protein n=1 Tax=Nocardioides sp. HDW12B TaxID=2714939 RepID=UPI001409BAB7|nr:DUF305 domain-containing protein [Nocardioides sp. HDW12B]QIK66401.1 DUF305 domain-containing protein [Nocardioides sp. HDW12B]